MEIEYEGIIYHLGDTVYIKSQQEKKKNVVLLEKIWKDSSGSTVSETFPYIMLTVLVEIIRDSKNNYFFQRSRIIMVEISRSRIIRITNYSARTYMCAQVQPRFVSRATTMLWSRRSRRKRLNHQSRLHCLPDKFRHLGHGLRCDSDGLGPERRPNGP